MKYIANKSIKLWNKRYLITPLLLSFGKDVENFGTIYYGRDEEDKCLFNFQFKIRPISRMSGTHKTTTLIIEMRFKQWYQFSFCWRPSVFMQHLKGL